MKLSADQEEKSYNIRRKGLLHSWFRKCITLLASYYIIEFYYNQNCKIITLLAVMLTVVITLLAATWGPKKGARLPACLRG